MYPGYKGCFKLYTHVKFAIDEPSKAIILDVVRALYEQYMSISDIAHRFELSTVDVEKIIYHIRSTRAGRCLHELPGKIDVLGFDTPVDVQVVISNLDKRSSVISRITDYLEYCGEKGSTVVDISRNTALADTTVYKVLIELKKANLLRVEKGEHRCKRYTLIKYLISPRRPDNGISKSSENPPSESSPLKRVLDKYVNSVNVHLIQSLQCNLR